MTESKSTRTILKRIGAAAFRTAALAAAVCLTPISSPRAEVVGGGDGLYSIEFREMTIPEALKRLNEATGVPIVLRKGSERKISARSYAKQDLDHILKDLLRRADHIVRWNYLDDAVASVDIWIFDSPVPGKQESAAVPGDLQPGGPPKSKSALRSQGNERDAGEKRHMRPARRRVPQVAPATQAQEGEPADSDGRPEVRDSVEEDRSEQVSEAARPSEEKEKRNN